MCVPRVVPDSCQWQTPKKTLTTKDTENTKKSANGAGLGSILSCGEGTVYCSLATREVSACAGRMPGANGYSPSQAGESWTPSPFSFFRDPELALSEVEG